MTAPSIDLVLPSIPTAHGLWTPATSGEAIAYNLGFCGGYDAADRGSAYREGRREGWRAGRESFAGDLLPGLRHAWGGLWRDASPDAVLELLARPWGDIRDRHLRSIDAAHQRRTFDERSREPRAHDFPGTEAA